MVISDDSYSNCISILPQYIRIPEHPSSSTHLLSSLLHTIKINVVKNYDFNNFLSVDLSSLILEGIRARKPVVVNDLLSTASFRFEYGINSATLHNVCLINKTTILYFEEKRDDNLNSFIPIDLNFLLQQSNSGFYSKDLKHSGWAFVSNKSLNLNSDSDYIWLPGNTVILSPPYVPSIFHHSQVLFTLFHLGLNENLYPGMNATDRILLVFLLLILLPLFKIKIILTLNVFTIFIK